MALRRLLFAAVLLATMLVPVVAAQASSNQESIMMDDDLLLHRGEQVRTSSLVRMSQLGVDTVRVSVLWRTVAQGANLTSAEIKRIRSASARKRARKQRARFRGSNPRTYPPLNWDRYDNLVTDAARLNLKVYFTITGPGPKFAHRKAPRGQRRNSNTYKPIPSRFRAFAKAVGKRYSGGYTDENTTKQRLPRVSMWSLWNEPNQAGWLSPQWERRGGKRVPASPSLYRQLYAAGRGGLASSGHNGDVILLGETAPLGSSGRGPRSSLRPAMFLRELARGKTSLRATGFAHHAYTKRLPPTTPSSRADDLTLANLGALGTLLDRLASQSGGRIPAGLPIWITEFGYESNPPDPRNGISLTSQADFNQRGEFLAYGNPRVPGFTQFLLRDAGPLKRFKKNSRNYWFTYQSGLFTVKGQAKPAASAYLLPFVANKAGANVSFWGQLRFRPNGAADTARIQWRPSAQAPWAQLGGPIQTSPRGHFTATSLAPSPTAEFRAVYVNPANGQIVAESLPAKP